MLIAANFLLWIVVALLGVAVAALARQVGVLHERIAPMGALVTDGGPKAGDAAPVVRARTVGGHMLTLGGEDAGGKSTLLVFVAPDCPVCKKVIPIAIAMAGAERLRLVFAGDGDDADYLGMIERQRMQGYDLVNDAQLGLAYHVGKLPAAVLIRADGRIAARGLVNSREHLESLVVADETGYPSAQAFVRDASGARKLAAL